MLPRWDLEEVGDYSSEPRADDGERVREEGLVQRGPVGGARHRLVARRRGGRGGPRGLGALLGARRGARVAPGLGLLLAAAAHEHVVGVGHVPDAGHEGSLRHRRRRLRHLGLALCLVLVHVQGTVA